MKILLTNDDGIQAEGIAALVAALSPKHEVYVVAPEMQQSAKSHALTLHQPIFAHQVTRFTEPGVMNQWAVSGTPVDCVKLAIEVLLKGEIDLIVSGINHGPNLAEDVIYSGTVSAALEGTLYHIPSIAMSVNSFRPNHFDHAARYLAEHLEDLYSLFTTYDFTLNLNFPDLPVYKGTRLTILGVIEYTNVFTQRQTPHGSDYYWIAGDRQIDPAKNIESADVLAVEEGYVSITPIKIAYQHAISHKSSIAEWL